MKNSPSWLGPHFDLKNVTSSLEELLTVRFGEQVNDVLHPMITKPFQDLLSRPGKRIRGRLVEMGYELSLRKAEDSSPPPSCQVLAQAIELLHAGSLAIDDLQDGSKMRRGQPALHMKYGQPLTIAIGNTLYFWPLELIQSLQLPSDQEVQIYRIYHRTLVRAHLGQLFDVGIPIDTLPQNRIWDVCMASMELKSGSLFSLGILMGACINRAPDDWLEELDCFSHGFGMALQMFDDIGNIQGRLDPGKRWEDIMMRRPTWVWACAARYYSKDVFREFVAAAHQLPHDSQPMETWLEEHDFIKKSKNLALTHMETCFKELEVELTKRELSTIGFRRLHQLATEISHAYE